MQATYYPLPDNFDIGPCVFKKDGFLLLANGMEVHTQNVSDVTIEISDGIVRLDPGMVVVEMNSGHDVSFAYFDDQWCEVVQQPAETLPNRSSNSYHAAPRKPRRLLKLCFLLGILLVLYYWREPLLHASILNWIGASISEFQ